MNWQESAVCATHEEDWWFGRNTTAKAIKVCQTCPVKQECLAFAMESEGGASRDHRYGIFGGLGPTARARLAGASHVHV